MNIYPGPCTTAIVCCRFNFAQVVLRPGHDSRAAGCSMEPSKGNCGADESLVLTAVFTLDSSEPAGLSARRRPRPRPHCPGSLPPGPGQPGQRPGGRRVAGQLPPAGPARQPASRQHHHLQPAGRQQHHHQPSAATRQPAAGQLRPRLPAATACQPAGAGPDTPCPPAAGGQRLQLFLLRMPPQL